MKRASDPDIAFHSHINKTETCWLWTASRNNVGYGKLKYCGRYYSAHRLAWIMAKGDIPVGMLVLHRCDNPVCVNPDHLWLGTQSENMKDCAAKKRLKNQFTGEEEPCSDGHLLTGKRYGPRTICSRCGRATRPKTSHATIPLMAGIPS